jgi:membrane protein DedA with SNARE-associated domain
MEHLAAQWLARFGPFGLFAVQMLGIFGLPIPDETIMVLAGTMIRQGRLPLAATATAAVAGAIAGISLSFAIGRVGGRALLSRSRSRFVHPAAVDRAERWFRGVGKWLLVVGYFIPGVRHVTAIVAGASGVSTRAFGLLASIGAALWVGCFLTIGYTLADRWRAILAEVHRYTALLVLLAMAAVIGYLIWTRHRPPR